MDRADERGLAIVMAMFMTLLVSALALGMTHVARTETESTASYTTMAQTRYAAESGVAAAANYLLSSAYANAAPGTAGDPLSNYTLVASPVVRSGGGGVVELSSVADASNYPVSGVITAFSQAASGTLPVGGGTVEYGARARLLAMRELTDSINGQALILQTWEITGIGRRGGAGSAEVEVTAIIDRQPVPVYRYAAFATSSGCSSLSFEGGATTGSYDSRVESSGAPTTSSTSGNVGTNGNLALSGATTQIYGTLSTPRAGVGSCTDGNVTAATIEGNRATVHGGLVELPQIVEYPTPPEPSPLPPTTGITFERNCPTGVPDGTCTVSSNTVTLTPTSGTPYVLGNVSVQGQTELVLHGGTYIFNSISVTGSNTRIRVAGTGPVIIQIAGQEHSQPIYLAGNSLSNPTFDPANLQFIYGGTDSVYVAGGSEASALIYAPLADVTLAGNSDFYGAIVGSQLTVLGSAKLYYDMNLSRTAQTSGNPVMSSFTWRTM
jgi:hypothetical protein